MTLNKLCDALSGLHADDALKERTLLAAANAKARRRRSIKGLTAAAACTVILTAAAGGRYLYITPVYAVSIDVNPSIELNANIFDRVIGAKSYNEEGGMILSAVDVKNMKCTDAINALLSSPEMSVYLDENADTSLTVSGNSKEKTMEVIDEVSGCHGGGARLHCSGMSEEEAEAARDIGLTPGKYSVYSALKEFEPELTPEDACRMSVRELRGRLSLYTDVQPETGSGHGGGHRHRHK